MAAVAALGLLAPRAGLADSSADAIKNCAAKNWCAYHRTTNKALRHSPLDQVNTSNVWDLRPVWIFQPGQVLQGMHPTPLVVDGVMYVAANPSTVAGWAHGRSWITPGLLLARGDFAHDVLFSDINYIPYDRYPRSGLIRRVSEKISQGLDISRATIPDGAGAMAMSNVMADRDEDFNTRYGSYKGWQLAIQKVSRPIPRQTAPLDLRAMVLAEVFEPGCPR